MMPNRVKNGDEEINFLYKFYISFVGKKYQSII